jgi:hypothetical protein
MTYSGSVCFIKYFYFLPTPCFYVGISTKCLVLVQKDTDFLHERSANNNKPHVWGLNPRPTETRKLLLVYAKLCVLHFAVSKTLPTLTFLPKLAKVCQIHICAISWIHFLHLAVKGVPHGSVLALVDAEAIFNALTTARTHRVLPHFFF